jgi:hypothetical protein
MTFMQLINQVRGVFLLRNVNVVVFFTIYLIATCFGHTTTVGRVSSKKICLPEDGRMTETCSN